MSEDIDAAGRRAAQRWETRKRYEYDEPPDEYADVVPLHRFAVTRMSDVVCEQVSWHWQGRLPVGKVVTLDGDPGVGKSTLALTFAAKISTGGMWPDGALCAYPGDVVLLSAEDGLADTIRPRLDAAAADVTRVHAVQGVPLADDPSVLRMPTLADMEQIRDVVMDTQARLLVVDVLMAYMPAGVDAHRDQDVRQVLARLSALTERTGCTVLLLRHLNKGKGDALYRGGGSIGIVGAARVGLLAANDPDDDALRVLAPLKNNLAAPTPSLAYQLVPADNGVSRVQWIGESSHDATDLLGYTDDAPGAATEAQNWLEDYLTQEGPCGSQDVKAAAKKAGHAERTLQRARKKLRVVIESKGMPRQTFWSLP